MTKIILNGTFGGYGWSEEAIRDLEIIKGKRIDPYEGKEELREDPDAIALLLEKGPEYCSDKFAKLYIAEYDPELWIADIHEYDGNENLDLTPRLTEEQVRACKSMDEVVDLLKARRLFCDRKRGYSFVS